MLGVALPEEPPQGVPGTESRGRHTQFRLEQSVLGLDRRRNSCWFVLSSQEPNLVSSGNRELMPAWAARRTIS
jgi:hypothetical protein